MDASLDEKDNRMLARMADAASSKHRVRPGSVAGNGHTKKRRGKQV